MTPPTSDELRAAYDQIMADGPNAPLTLMLAALSDDPTLSGWLQRVRDPHVAQHDEALVHFVLMYGLNLGLRIGEARARKAAS